MQVSGVGLLAACCTLSVHLLWWRSIVPRRQHRPQNWNQLGIYFYIGCLYSCQHGTRQQQQLPSTSFILPLTPYCFVCVAVSSQRFLLSCFCVFFEKPSHWHITRLIGIVIKFPKILMGIDNKMKRYRNKFPEMEIYRCRQIKLSVWMRARERGRRG